MPQSKRRLEERSTTIRIPITPRSLPRLIKAGIALRKGFRGQDLDDERPEFVMHNEKSNAILALAQDLAADEREDEDAVEDIRKLAGRNEFALRLAALGARQWGQHDEFPIPNLTHRLLQAAVSGRPVAPLDPRDQERLEQIEEVSQLPRDQIWQLLVDREPRLQELEAEAESGRFGPPHFVIPDAMPREEQHRVARERLEGLARQRERLEPLVGPASGSDDVLLRTHMALEAAHLHLSR
jgi:hypothetical protein